MSAAPRTAPLSCTDPDGDRLRLLVNPPTLGGLAGLVDRGDGTGSVQFTPPPFPFGEMSFTYVATDGLLVSPPATILYFFQDVAPTCTPVTSATSHVRPVTVQLRCSDADGDPLSYGILRPADPDKGSVGAPDAAGRVTFTPNPAFTGVAHFRFKGSDGVGSAGAEAQVNVTNTAPVCRNPDRAIVPNDRSAVLTATCFDPDGDPLTVVTEAPPAYGELGPVTRSGRTISVSYTPQPGYVGDDRVVLQASDGSPRGGEVTIPVTVTPPGGAVDTSIRSDASDLLDRVKLGRIRFIHLRLRMRTLHGVGAGSRLVVKLSHHGRLLGHRTIRVGHGPTPVSLGLSRRGRRYVAHRHRVTVRLSLTLVSPTGGKVNDWRLLRLLRHGHRWSVR